MKKCARCSADDAARPIFADPEELTFAAEWLDKLMVGYTADARRGKPRTPADVFVYLNTWYEGWISEADDSSAETQISLREAVMLAATAIHRLALGDLP